MSNEKMTSKDLLAQVKEGVSKVYDSQAWKDMLVYQSRFWKYSFANQFLIRVQRPEASEVAGFHTWKGMGRIVKKGEKGIAILRPIFSQGSKKEKLDVKDPVSGKVVGQVEKLVSKGALVGFSVAYVFDKAQTEGAEVPELVHSLKGAAPQGLWASLVKLSEGLGVPVKLETMREGRGGFVKKAETEGKAEIRINETEAEAQRVKVLIHELSHYLAGHVGERADKVSREQAELEAESAALIVGQALGIDFSEYSFGYLASWAMSMTPTERDKELEKAGNTASRIAKKILEALEGREAEALTLAA